MKRTDVQVKETFTFSAVTENGPIELEIPTEDFDVDAHTLWISTKDIATLCNTNMDFIINSRVFSTLKHDNHLFEKCQRYKNTTQYSLPITIPLLLEYAPQVCLPFIEYVITKLCELSAERVRSEEMTVSQLPKFILDVRHSINALSEEICSLQDELQELREELETLREKCAPNGESISSSRAGSFVSISEFLMQPIILKAFNLSSMKSDNDKLFVELFRTVSNSVNHMVRLKLSGIMGVPYQEACRAFQLMISMLQSDIPLSKEFSNETLASLEEFIDLNVNTHDTFLKFRYESEFLRKSMVTSIQRGYFSAILRELRVNQTAIMNLLSKPIGDCYA